MLGKFNIKLMGERAKSESERERGGGIGPQTTNNDLHVFILARMPSESLLHIPYMDVPCIGVPLCRVLYIETPLLCIEGTYIGGTPQGVTNKNSK